MSAHFILYVSDQDVSTKFYASVLAMAPTMNVPGMTEFELTEGVILGLMPEGGVIRLFGERVSIGRNPPPSRAEVYLLVSNADEYHRRSLAAGAEEIDPMAERDWGHRAAYSRDRDGHILAFAEPI